MPQTDRHKEREIPIEFDFYNTLESLPMNNRCTIIMVSCGNATIKINNHIQTVTSPAILCISQYDNFQCLEHTHLSAKAFHWPPQLFLLPQPRLRFFLLQLFLQLRLLLP